jgi:hypothetical protein
VLDFNYHVFRLYLGRTMTGVRDRKFWRKWVHNTIRNCYLVYGPKLDTVFLNSQNCMGSFPSVDLTNLEVYNPTFLFKSVSFEIAS